MNRIQMTRRGLLAAGAAGSLNGWFGTLAQASAAGMKPVKKCILLYMHGGASHIDTFDPKPGNGEFKPIATSVTGITVCETLPKVAKLMKDIAVIRSMSTSEGSHGRASYLIHTGYRSGVGAITHPSMGSVVGALRETKGSEIPSYVVIGGGGSNPGYLGAEYAALTVYKPETGVDNVKPAHSLEDFDQGYALTAAQDLEFGRRKQSPAIVDHQQINETAYRLMHSPKIKAFELKGEPESVTKLYGDDEFARSCLLARRLVEAGVSYVEIPLGSWDAHTNNFPVHKKLTAQVDQGLSALLTDLKQRGLLDDTLVVWMGDFGRTPQVKNTGRGHYPAAWTTLLCGAGLKTGQVIGRTDKDGGTVTDAKVSATDFLATVYSALGLDYTHEFKTRSGRPMRVVMKGEKVIKELF